MAASKMLSKLSRCKCVNPFKGKHQGNPYSESILMRRKIYLGLSSKKRKQLIAAILARDSKLSLSYSQKLRHSKQAKVRYAATLVVAYALARQDLTANRNVIQLLIEDLKKDVKKIKAFPVSDTFFLAAILAQNEGKVEKAMKLLKKALIQEPTFFNAAVLSVRLQIKKVIQVQIVW